MTDTDLWAARRERARRWIQAGGDLRGYPALAVDDETADTLAAAPSERAEKKARPQQEPKA